MLFDDRSQTVRAAVAVAGRSGRVRLSLVDEGSGQARVSRDLDVVGSLTAELDADARCRPAGISVKAEVLDGAGGAGARHADYRIVKLPARARERLNTWYDERNVLHVDGKPTFVLGLYTTSGYSTDAQYLRPRQRRLGRRAHRRGADELLINYHLGRAPMPALGVYMDDLQARGMRYLQTVNFYHRADGQYRQIEYRGGEAGRGRAEHAGWPRRSAPIPAWPAST